MGYRGDIAIDDVTVVENECKVGEYKSHRLQNYLEYFGVFVGRVGACYMYLKCSSFTDASCDFDSDLCGWQNDQFDDFDWWRMKGSTATPNTGPRADHTSSNGQQM